MHDRENRKIIITIEGEDYDKLEAFEKEHENCIYKYPNMSGGNFMIEAVADGFGMFKSVTCVCGESVHLTGEYDLRVDLDKKPVFQVVPEDPETEELLKMLLWMKRRPGLFYGKKRDLALLTNFISGFECAAKLHNKNMGWSHIHEKLYREYTQLTDGKDYSEEEQFQLYLDTLEKVLHHDFPEYAKRFCNENKTEG